MVTLRNPGELFKNMADQMSWLTQFLGDDFFRQMQSAVPGAVQSAAPGMPRAPGFPPPRPGSKAGGQHQASQPPAGPPTDVYLTGDDVVLCIALPGLGAPDQVKVSLAGATTITLEAFVPPNSGLSVTVRQERFTGYCSRTIALPVPVRQDGARATYTDGILEVRLRRLGAGEAGGGLAIMQVDQPQGNNGTRG
ncbi:MAG TPA: Hsp20/alpha crystallin family protein [Symbiobacteriaceae bacterium]|nr:Hsp20/alpha crystallin family protein [Symbiobacteriaceae bacterium]